MIAKGVILRAIEVSILLESVDNHDEEWSGRKQTKQADNCVNAKSFKKMGEHSHN